MRVAIIGGGFSAISLSLQLIAKNCFPLTLFICGIENDFGLGTAYSTPYPWHLLNVRASQMGASSDDPEGFYNWLLTHEGLWRKADPAFESLQIKKDSFLPRKLYGIYLSAILNEIKEMAAEKNIIFRVIKDEVIDIAENQNDLSIVFKTHPNLNVDKVVLSTGVKPIKKLNFQIPTNKLIQNIWGLSKEELAKTLSNTTQDSTVFIVGTGLTMIDMITSLDKLNYQGKIVALSRHGKLPQAHSEKPLKALGNVSTILSAKNLAQKINAFKQELTSIIKSGGEWIQLFEAIRPITTELWKQLSLKDKKLFLKYYLPLWGIHRHRMPLDSVHLVDRLKKINRLKIIQGTIVNIYENEIPEIQFKLKDGSLQIVNADYIFNCTGPNYNLEQSENTLIRNLLKRGWIASDPLRLGVKSSSQYKVEGPLSNSIFVIGALLFGECFETTSVPDLRNHANEVASLLCSKKVMAE